MKSGICGFLPFVADFAPIRHPVFLQLPLRPRDDFRSNLDYYPSYKHSSGRLSMNAASRHIGQLFFFKHANHAVFPVVSRLAINVSLTQA